MSKVVWGPPEEGRSKRYHREWLGQVSGKWRFAKSYRTRFFAITSAILCSLESKQRVIDTKGDEGE